MCFLLILNGTSVFAESKTDKKTSAEPVFPVVLIKTSMGDIKVELYPERAPVTVKNFLAYVDAKHYNGTIFHRVIPNFMIQGGGFDKSLAKKQTNGPIKNEAHNGLSNERGTIAMARTGVVDSATNQFFINLKNNAFLDHRSKSTRGYGYCVFGKIIAGMDVLDKISKVRTTRKKHYSDVPAKTIMLNEIVRSNRSASVKKKTKKLKNVYF